MSPPKRPETPAIAAGHLDWFEAVAFIYIYAMTKAFLAFPERLAVGAQTAAWSVPVFSGILSVVWVWPLISVLKAYPGKDIVEISRKLLGRYVAFFVGAAFYLFNLGIAITSAAEIADTVNTILLPLTPEIFLIFITTVVALYVALKGLEVMGRICVIIGVVVIVLLVLSSALSINMWQTDSVFPLLGPGVGKLAKTYGVRQSMYGELLALGVVAPYLRKPRDTGKVAVWSATLLVVTMTLAVLTCQMVFPYPSLGRIIEPLLRVTRIINLGRFFQRFDPILAPAWLAAGHLQLAIGILVASLALASTLRIKRLNLLIVINAVLAIAASRLIPNSAMTIVVDFDILRPYSLILLVTWPIALWIADRFRSRSHSEKGGQPGK